MKKKELKNLNLKLKEEIRSLNQKNEKLNFDLVKIGSQLKEILQESIIRQKNDETIRNLLKKRLYTEENLKHFSAFCIDNYDKNNYSIDINEALSDFKNNPKNFK